MRSMSTPLCSQPLHAPLAAQGVKKMMRCAVTTLVRSLNPVHVGYEHGRGFGLLQVLFSVYVLMILPLGASCSCPQ